MLWQRPAGGVLDLAPAALQEMHMLRVLSIANNNLHDITPHLGPLRVLLLFYGGRRRDGDGAPDLLLRPCLTGGGSCEW